MAWCITRGTVASFVRAFVCHFYISLIKALDVFCISNFVLLVFPYYMLQNSYFTHTHIYRSQSTLDLTGNDSATASYDFENLINLAEDEGEDDCEVPASLQDCCSRKRGKFNHMKSQWKQ